MNKQTRKLLFAIIKIVASVVAVLLLWWLFAEIAHNELVLPTPWEVAKQTFLLLGKGQTYAALALTLLRALIAFSVSAALALSLALFAGVCQQVRPFADAVVTFFRAVPTVAVILLAMVAFKSTIVPVIVAVLVVFPVMYSAFTREIFADVQLVGLCKVFDVSAGKRVRYVLLPQMARAALPQCKDSFPLAVKVIIAGEVLALPRLGLGKEMYVAKVNLLTAQVLALTLLVLLVCFAWSFLFTLCERRWAK